MHELVAELGERHTLLVLARQTLLHRVFCHHVVYGDEFTYIADEVEESKVFHPVVIVDQYRCVGCIGIEIKKVGELTLDTFLIVAESCLVEELAFLALHRWVAYHAGGTTDESDRFVAATLEMLEHHHTYKVAYMEAVGCRVDTEVANSHAFFKFVFSSRHHGVYHAAPGEFFYKIHFYLFNFH